MNAFGLQRLGI